MPETQTWLARTLIELAGIGAGSLVEEGYARVVVARLADLLGPAEVGLMLVDDGGHLRTAAVSGGVPLRLPRTVIFPPS